ncbi:MAG: aspartyl-tRNA(Asn)/glutamyl-tRNA (Gln) amidotransferase subunit B, partial [Parcubacteria group bacterium Gr01-1014_29]
GWDDINEITISQRLKESAHDYRYFPEPDLPPLHLTKEEGFDIEAMRSALPELPSAKRTRFSKQYGLSEKMTEFFVADKHFADYFEKAASELLEWVSNSNLETGRPSTPVQLMANYMSSDLQALLIAKDASIKDIRITPENLAELVKMIHTNELSSRAAKDVLARMFADGSDPSDIVRDQGLSQVSDAGALEEVVKKIIQENKKPVEDYKAGKEATLQVLVGKVMKETKGAANPEVVRELLTGLLGGV